MKQRSISATGIVIVSIVPAILGNPVFMLAIMAIMALAYRELLQLMRLADPIFRIAGYGAIVAAAVAAWLQPDGTYLPIVLALGTLVPLGITVFRESSTSEPTDWSLSVGAAFYLALPAFAAVALRGAEGSVDSDWFQDAATSIPGQDATAAGLAWFLLALLVTWMSDTAAYLVGKSVGKNKLIPRVSPNKTIEGAIGGLVASGITGVLCTLLFGLPVHPLTAFLLGIVLGAVGMIGDLSESMLKRRAGVKDSGSLIPGHGGMLDRIDALIFVLVATWALQPLLA
jgi:phosphatidate cytidylyltransferase